MNTIRVRFKDIKVGQYFIREADGITYRKIIPQSDGVGIINARGVTTRNVVQVQLNDRIVVTVSDE